MTTIIALDPKGATVILDIRSLGYYKNRQAVLQQRLCKYFSFELLWNILEVYNSFINILQEETSKSVDPYIG